MSDDPPILLVVDGRPHVAASRAQTLQAEAGDALLVRAAATVGEALDAARDARDRLVAIVAEHDLLPGVSGLDLLARMSREAPQARRILVTGGDLQRLTREPAYAGVHAAFQTGGRFHDVASGIVQDALECGHALAASRGRSAFVERVHVR